MLDFAASRVIYTGDGSTDTFSVQDESANAIYFESNSHIKVAKLTVATGVIATLTEGVDYTLTGGPTTGSVVLSAGNLASGYKLAIWREQPLEQAADFQTSGNFSSDTHDLVADRDRRVDQDIKDIADRALKTDRFDVAYDAGSRQINNVSDPTSDQDAATKAYVDQFSGAADAAAAAASAAAAATSASDASTSASNAASSASAAAGSASTASTAASNASSSASSASTSASNASGSASAAASSASAASTSASNAAASETAAATSETNAGTSETNAATSASNAATSASNAATSASNAATSESNAAASYDAFDDRYLGSKASDPTLDNDGDALLTGALYWNSVLSRLKVYDGAAWDDPVTDAAASASAASTSASNASTSASNASTSETNAAASETLSQDWATKTDGIVEATDYAAKAWAIGGTGVTDTAGRGAAKEWATAAEDDLVDGSEYSAKHYSAKASTSASNAATSASNASTSASNASTSAGNASTSETNAATSATLSSDWATKTDGIVAATDYAAKAWAVGGTGVTDTAGRGAAKEWATAAEDDLVDGTEYSAKHYSAKASTSASNAATSASSASTSATNASNAQTAAEAARDAAIAASENLAWGYTFDSGTTAADPGTGKFRFNNATFGSATAMYINETADEGSIAATMDVWDDSSSSIKATVKVRNPLAPTEWFEFYISGAITDNGTWRTVPITPIATNGTITNGDGMLLMVLRNGDAGTGAVDSFNGRSGAVTPAASDYDASQVDNDSGVTGAFVSDALNTLNSGKQAASSNLTELAALSSADGNFIVGSATGWVVESGATARASLGLAIGSDVQAYDADLAALAALSGTNTIYYRSGADTWSAVTVASPLSFSGGNLGLTQASVDHGSIGGLGDDDHTQYAIISTGATAPASTPSRAGAIYVDTTADLAYVATGVAGSGDWDRLLVSGDIGSNVQAYSANLASWSALATSAKQDADAELTAIAGLTSAADRLPYFTGSGTAALATFTSFGRSLVDDADAATARSTLGLVIGTNVQAQDAELSAIAGLTSAADSLPYFTGSGTAALATFTTFGRSLVDDADAGTARTTLGLGSLATLSSVNDGNWSGTDLAIANGGTGQSTASAAFGALKQDATTAATGVVEWIASGEWKTKTASKALEPSAVWGDMAEVTLTDAASIALAMNTGFDFVVTLGGNRTLANPTNTQVGQKGRIRVVQDATGSRTLSFGTSYEFADGTAPTLTTTANAQDVLYYDVISSTRILVGTVLNIS